MNFPDRCSRLARGIDAMDGRRPRPLAGSIVLAIAACLLAPCSTVASTSAPTTRSGGDGDADADGSEALNLRQLVDAARRVKAAELDQAAARLMPEAVPGRNKSASPRRRAEPGLDGELDLPRLWALHSVADRWQAEIVHEGRVRVIDDISAPTARLGPWRVIALREQGLLLTRAGGGGPRSARTLLLIPPAQGGLASGQGVAPMAPAAPAGLHPVRLAAHEALSMPTAAEDDAVRRAASLPSSPHATPDSPR